MMFARFELDALCDVQASCQAINEGLCAHLMLHLSGRNHPLVLYIYVYIYIHIHKYTCISRQVPAFQAMQTRNKKKTHRQERNKKSSEVSR